jgi:HTH-type transcriptional regulator/antitoxin HigA
MSKQHRTAANDLPAGDVFHPGAFLSEEMEAQGLKQVELAKELGLSKTEINLVVHGKRGITVPLALKLEKVLGVSAETWMSLQMKFDIYLEKKKNEEGLRAKEDKTAGKALLGDYIAYA